ncbi:copine-8-like [Patiria miniata]|uniref:C2 domain-containing protein n=1 Tax=Patiria miniata TaxID=46514 RepID=A0A914AUH1_PATMI|nr:copine-8-like [Patiria miniata]
MAMSLGQAQEDASTKVELTVSCSNLPKGLYSTSDTFCVMRTREEEGPFREFGRTEVICNNLNPKFFKKFVIDYTFEEKQFLGFTLYDNDSTSPNLDKHRCLGDADCTLGEIMGSKGCKFTKHLRLNEDSGSITIQGEELSDCQDMITLQFKGDKLDKKGFISKSDPFLVFHRCNEDGSFTICHKTEYIKRTLSPRWKSINIMLRTLCNGDKHRTIKVECFDWNQNGSHNLIGAFETSVTELVKGPGLPNVYPLIHPKKQAKKKSYRNSGLITLFSCKIEPHARYSFLDYIRGGCQLAFTVAIDFTASNGDPQQRSSLHYINAVHNQFESNAYLRVLQAVGEVVQDYSHDKTFPAFGFGARIPPRSQVQQQFSLNGNPDDPVCVGVEGVVTAYKEMLPKVRLDGPTEFAPIINQVASFAEAKQDGSEYLILLIITDGCVCDMDNTKEAIVNAAQLPMSIIIVGVGDRKFTSMGELAGKEVRVSSRGRFAERDIVQFVPVKQCEGRYIDIAYAIRQERFAKEVLRKIPDQVTYYLRNKNIVPGNFPSPRQLSELQKMKVE